MAEFRPDKKQEEVINFIGGRALVLAAPGCGKTAILSHRVAKAHQYYGIDYSQMLCLTFTNRASRSMRERVEEVVGSIPTDLYVGNLHRFCIRFLYENEIVSLDTGIMDDTDQEETIGEIIYPNGGTVYAYEIQDVLNYSNMFFETEYFPEELQIHKLAVEKRKQQLARSGRDFTLKHYEEYARKYVSFKEENHIIDFDDILLLTYRALMEKDYREKYKLSSFKWIQVDEVQDLNPLQLAIIDKLTASDFSAVVYLGDQRQAIYSFLGASKKDVNGIREKCGDNVFLLSNNYRSPVYLLDMLNDYAIEQLKVGSELLPHTNNDSHIDDALTIMKCYDNAEQFDVLATIVRQFCGDYNESKEGIGVLVKTNAEADNISEELKAHQIRHLKLTKKDMFKTVPFKTLYSHLSVVVNDTRFSEWARILYSSKVIEKISDARRCIRKMRDLGLTPFDLIKYDDSSYFMEFCKSYKDKEIVIFDTETTGLDIFNDDIIQIAAMKMKHGVIVPGSELDIIIETDKEIPPTLGEGRVNPMVEEYARREHLTPQAAFELFVEYVGDDELLGHNANYDIHILENNIKRRTRNINFTTPVFWDTLKMSRMLDPNLRKHTLEGLLEFFHLEGNNSHNALDDIRATHSLVDHCYERMSNMIEAQKTFLSHPVMKRIQARMLRIYAPFYEHTESLLYSDVVDDAHTFDAEFDYIYKGFVEKKFIEPIERFDYMKKLFNKVVIQEKDVHFYDQLVGHLYEFRTFNEADLYQNHIVDETIHIMTIHKAKGLEFDNVLIFNVSEGSMPHYNAVKYGNVDEEARVLYVALSRAKKRIYITYAGSLSQFIKNHDKVLEHFYDMPEGQKQKMLKFEEIVVKNLS